MTREANPRLWDWLMSALVKNCALQSWRPSCRMGNRDNATGQQTENQNERDESHSRLTPELTHAGQKDAAREAELSAPSGVVCSDFVSRYRLHRNQTPKMGDAARFVPESKVEYSKS